MPKLMHSLLLLASLLGFGCKTNLSRTELAEKAVRNVSGDVVLAKIVAAIKVNLGDTSGLEFRRHMIKHLDLLKLTDRNGRWLVQSLEPISESILPVEVNMKSVFDLIDNAALAMKTNPAFLEILAAAAAENSPVLRDKFSSSGKIFIPQLVAWAAVLENITKAELDDPKVIKELSDYWINERKKGGIKLPKNVNNIFGSIKLASVEEPIRKIIGFFDGAKLDPKFAQGFLPLNIFEAIGADRLIGHSENSAAGWPLHKNAPGDKPNPKLGTGPASFSPDRNKIEIRMSLPKDWADLYQTWNMAFVSQVNDGSFWYVKLFVPTVSNYKNVPEEYIYRRVLALYTAMNHGGMASDEYKAGSADSIDWVDEELTKLMGKINKTVADGYSRKVEAARN